MNGKNWKKISSKIKISTKKQNKKFNHDILKKIYQSLKKQKRIFKYT